MRQKDVLEIEIGLKNIILMKKSFEDRQFILRFLNKLDPELACKGRIMILGSDLLNIQQMQKISENEEKATSFASERTKRVPQGMESNGGCFTSSNQSNVVR